MAIILTGCFGKKEKTNVDQSNEGNQAIEQNDEPQTNDDLFAGSIKSLLDENNPKKCSLQFKDNDQTVVSTIYVADNKIRSDVMMEYGEQKMEQHTIMQDNIMYSWSEITKEGYIIDTDEMAKISKEMQAKFNMPAQDIYDNFIDYEKDYNLNCQDWRKSDNLFEIPANINFIDLAEQMRTMTEDMPDFNAGKMPPEIEAMMKEYESSIPEME